MPKPTKSASSRIVYLDFLKFISIVAVILIHLITNDLYRADPTTPKWQIVNILSCLARFAVPVFLMVTGALLGNPKKPISPSKICRHYLPRIVVAYFFWDLIYAVISTAAPMILHSAAWDFGVFWQEILAGHYHMWYLVALAGIYILLPLLRRITADPATSRYFFALFLVLSAISAIAQFSGANILSDYLGFSQLLPLLSYPAYFILGSFLHSTDFKKRARVVIYTVAAACTVFSTIAFALHAQNKTFPASYDFYVPILSIAVFVLIKQLCARHSRLPRLIQSISEHTLGIYLVHVAVLNLFIALFHGLDTAWLSPLPIPILLAVSLLTVAILLISWLCSLALARIAKLAPPLYR